MFTFLVDHLNFIASKKRKGKFSEFLISMLFCQTSGTCNDDDNCSRVGTVTRISLSSDIYVQWNYSFLLYTMDSALLYLLFFFGI